VETGCLGKEGNHNVDWYLVAESSGLLSVVWSYVWVIGSVAVTLGFVIFVHELGHFLAAKACGVKCEKFYIGFDVPMSIGPLKLPAALCRFRWGETEYGIGSLPLGGYVKMLGQDDNPSAQARENERIRIPKTTSGGPATDVRNASEASTDSAVSAVQAIGDTDPATDPTEQEFELDPRSYPAKPVWQRMIIISAGVVMNLIFAVVFAALAYTMGVRYVPCIIGETIADSPAWREGIQPEDQVLQIDRRWQPDEHLRFRRDLMPQVLLNGGRQPMELLLRPRGASQADWMTIQPENRLRAVKQAFSADPLAPDDRGASQDPRAGARLASARRVVGNHFREDDAVEPPGAGGAALLGRIRIRRAAQRRRDRGGRRCRSVSRRTDGQRLFDAIRGHVGSANDRAGDTDCPTHGR
jgi:hypothetical protein